MPKLENWKLIKNVPEILNRLLPEKMLEDIPPVLVGAVKDDEEHRVGSDGVPFEGSEIRTSPLKRFDLKAMKATTQNTEYVLGMVDADYAKALRRDSPEVFALLLENGQVPAEAMAEEKADLSRMN
jgi:hypothetical protein